MIKSVNISIPLTFPIAKSHPSPRLCESTTIALLVRFRKMDHINLSIVSVLEDLCCNVDEQIARWGKKRKKKDP